MIRVFKPSINCVSIESVKGGHVLSECKLYNNLDDTGFIGNFKCHSNDNFGIEILKYACDLALEYNIKELIGPVDGSIWNGYRFKIGENSNLCEFPGEPINPEHYIGIWKKAGFNICDEYSSNFMLAPNIKEHEKQRFARLLYRYTSRGILFREIKANDSTEFNHELSRIYSMVITGYTKFKGYTDINHDEFIDRFKMLRENINEYKMSFIAERNGTPVGFIISIGFDSNQGKQVCIPYMYASEGYPGLGAALASLVRDRLDEEGLASIAALIHTGKASDDYYKDMTYKINKYILMNKVL